LIPCFLAPESLVQSWMVVKRTGECMVSIGRMDVPVGLEGRYCERKLVARHRFLFGGLSTKVTMQHKRELGIPIDLDLTAKGS
uniref:Type VI secretion system baseplate subunit TssG n=1 Tax=Haemonchus placei TaxID=6290 RepID=A0A0N4VVF7_HAEPC